MKLSSSPPSSGYSRVDLVDNQAQSWSQTEEKGFPKHHHHRASSSSFESPRSTNFPRNGVTIKDSRKRGYKDDNRNGSVCETRREEERILLQESKGMI